jgi:hypothetical protein
MPIILLLAVHLPCPSYFLLCKYSALGLYGDYVNWFCSYLAKRHIQVCVSGITPLSFEVFSNVSQGSVLGLLLFSVFINGLCDTINYSWNLLFADGIKVCCSIKSPNKYNLLSLSLIVHEVGALLLTNLLTC